MIQFLAILSISVVSYLLFLQLLPWCIEVLTRYNIVDIPSERKAHREPITRGGGVVLILVTPIYFFLSSQIYGLSLFQQYPLLMAIFLVGGISLLDDIKEQSKILRLLVHFLSAWILLKYGQVSLESELTIIIPYSETQLVIPAYIPLLAAIISLVGFTNLYNFLDGIDGISAAETIHLSIVILLLAWVKYDAVNQAPLIISISCLCLAFGCAFLKYNWHPAQLFLGDVGSITLGFLLGYCFFLLIYSDISLFVPAIIAALYYFADGGVTILLRIWKREKFWLPHNKHFFQQAMRKGKSQQLIVTNIIKCNIVLMGLSIVGIYWPLIGLVAGVIVTSATILLLKR